MLNTSLPAARLSAILAADAAGYSRLMAIDDRLTVELLDAAREVFRNACGDHAGRVVDMAGDSVLLAFDSAAAAVSCALAVQQRLAALASMDKGTLRLPFRIGVHLGDVIEKSDGSIYGDGVNLAARLQALAEPDEVMVSQAVRDLTGARSLARFEDAGEHRVKNVAEPVRAWRALPSGSAPALRADATTAERLIFAGRFELQPGKRRLLVDGEVVNLGARAFDLLLELTRRPDTLRTKNELLDKVWPGLVVEESNLHVQISALRKVLGGEVIATIPGRGYRFSANVEAGALAAARVAPPTAFIPVIDGMQLRTNLPATLPQLVGRAEDMAALEQLIGRHRLVSIVGAGGMGKTTIALHLTAGRQAVYRHGVCWVELANVSDADSLPSVIAAAMGVDIGRGEALKGLCAALAPLSMLLTLDNAEQVVEGVARVTQAVMDKAPGVRFVVTTQAPLKLPAERTYRIGSLTVPQGPLPAAQALEFGAVALFVERAQAADARFVLTDANAPSVIELCRQLDGLALAIELAAARAPMLGVQRLANSMADRLKVLTSSRNRIAPARQQTLRAALEWSHGFLDPRERAVFRRLSVFAGSASLSQVQKVVADVPDVAGSDLDQTLDEWAVLDALALLVDRSLVVALTPDDASEPRYRLLETPRLFAREQLQRAGEEAEFQQRHLRAVADHFDAAVTQLDSGSIGVNAWKQLMAADLDDGREALVAARAANDTVSVVQLASAMFWAVPRSSWRELLAMVDAVEPLIERVGSAELLARACWFLTHILMDTQRQRAAALARRCWAAMPAASGVDLAPVR